MALVRETLPLAVVFVVVPVVAVARPSKALEAEESGKTQKYATTASREGSDFAPVIFSVHGSIAREANILITKCAAKIAGGKDARSLRKERILSFIYNILKRATPFRNAPHPGHNRLTARIIRSGYRPTPHGVFKNPNSVCVFTEFVSHRSPLACGRATFHWQGGTIDEPSRL